MALPKPDPTRYRGGATSRLYKEDLQAWQDSQEPTVQPVVTPTVDTGATITLAEPTVEPVGEEEVVSLASTFDDAGPFAPDTGSGSGYREVGDVTPTTSTPDTNDLPYMEVPTDDVVFQTPEPGQYDNFGGRLVSGDTEDYERANTYNEMLDRGISPEMAQEWFDSGDSTNDAYTIIADDFLSKQSDFIDSLNALKEEGKAGQFEDAYLNSGFADRAAYLLDQYNSGNISKKDYETAWQREYNVNALKEGTNRFLFEIKAPRSSSKIDTIYRDPNARNYEAGDTILVVGNPEDPNTWGVTFEDIYYPNEANSIQQLQYFDRMLAANEPLPEVSGWVEFRDEFLLPGARTFLAMLTGGTSEQLYSAVRLLSGETLHGSDWANLAVGGLEQFGVIDPGTVTIDPSTGQEILTGGQGLFGLDYDTTVGIIKGAGSQDPVQLVTSLLPSDTLSDTLKNLGIPPDLANDPDFIEGVSKGLETVVEGGNLRDGLESGLAEYITEGGGFGGLPDIDIDIDLSGLEEALKPIADTFGTVADVVQTATEPFVDVIDEGIDVFGEKVVDPALQAAEDFVESIPTPELPEYLGEFPDLNLPSFDLPNINLGLNVQMPQLSATRTTDGLFSDELFKFKTEIGLTPTGPLLKPQERRAGQTPEQRQQREEVVDLFSRDPFASPFDRNIV